MIKSRLKKKRKFNLAFVFTIMASVLMSSLQVGFSFLSSNLQLGGLLSVLSSSEPSATATEIITNNPYAVVETRPNGSGYTTIIKGSSTAQLNNYIKLNNNASNTELWRILGITQYGIKIVKAEPIACTSTVYWDTNNAFWVNLPTSTAVPSSSTISNLTGASTLCSYLNTTYYNSLTNSSSANYIDPIYINHTASWDISPMYSSGSNNAPVYINGTPNQLKVSADPSAIGVGSFNGLPIGILSVEEYSLVSTTMPTSGTSNASYFSGIYLSGWLAVNNYKELTLSNRVSNGSATKLPSKTSTTMILNPASPTGFTYASKKTYDGTYYRPAMYLTSNVVLSAASSENAGSASNPYIITGLQ